MRRLIDANNLQFNGRNYNKSQVKAILDFIDAQPTAYDMDKVVEQLKALTGEECTLHECGIRSEHCKACIAKKAIDIVKAGGVDGN